MGDFDQYRFSEFGFTFHYWSFTTQVFSPKIPPSPCPAKNAKSYKTDL